MKIIPFISLLVLAGCASNSGVVPIGRDTYMVSRQVATMLSGSGTVKADAYREANQYCTNQNRSLQVVNVSESKPPYGDSNLPKAEIQFMCLDAKDAELARPKLKKEADTIIEIRK